MIYTLTTALQDRIVAITELRSTEKEQKEKEKLDEERRKEDVRFMHLPHTWMDAIMQNSLCFSLFDLNNIPSDKHTGMYMYMYASQCGMASCSMMEIEMFVFQLYTLLSTKNSVMYMYM